MLAHFDFLGWGAATISTIGLAATAFIFILGRLIVGRPGRAHTPDARWTSGKLSGSGSVRRPVSDPFLEGPSKERRCHFRRGGNPTQVAIGHPEDPSELARGIVVDRSSGGVCLELPTPLAIGAVVSVRPSAGTTIGTWLEAEVRHCHRDHGGWHVGLKFVRTPPLSVLWMFG